jgi:general secretion pathway protein C
MGRSHNRAKTTSRVSDAVEHRIVEVSLQNPDYGARRIAPLLKAVKILLSPSKIYTILKRNGLNTHIKRLASLEERHAPVSPLLQNADLPSPVEEIALTAEAAGLIAASSGVSPSPQRPRKKAGKASWFLTLFNLMLLALLILLGINTLQKAASVGFAPIAEAAIEAASVSPSKEKIAASLPLGSYWVIWQRDLFKADGKKQHETKKEISIDELALAAKNLGLKLLGTVVAGDPTMSRAIIDNRSTRNQEVYREGDRAGKVLIKKILRNKVVINTKKGNELLTVDFEEIRKGTNAIASRQQTASGSSSSSRKSGSQSLRAKTRTIQLERKEVETSLSDIDNVLQEVKISPSNQGGQSTGFELTNITPGSILAKMGLRNGTSVTGVNGEDITSPDQAADFFHRLREGGDITIQTRKSRGSRDIARTIRLKID